MSVRQEWHAWHLGSRRPCRVVAQDGRIAAIIETADEPAEPLWLAPPLFDLQINGYAGVDFQQDELTLGSLLHATRALRRDGCARYFFTLITDEWPRMLARVRRCAEWRASHPELLAALAGIHVEGPFLSEKSGFHGAHRPDWMLDPAVEDIRALRSAAGDIPLLLTIAPERHGALAAIDEAARLGMRVSLGHTDASADTIGKAVDAGARAFTHLANGCPRELDRHDNIIWRVCDEPGLTVSLIPDGIHVSPAPFRLLHRLLGERVYYTTDAMSAAGAPPGRYRLGATEVEVGADQIVRQPGKTNFAGSALSPIHGVFRAAEMLGCNWQECWRRFSETPARLVGVENDVRVGSSVFALVNPQAMGAEIISL